MRKRAMWWYNRMIMPLAIHTQKKIAFVPGMVDAESVGEVLLVCRKRDTPD